MGVVLFVGDIFSGRVFMRHKRRTSLHVDFFIISGVVFIIVVLTHFLGMLFVVWDVTETFFIVSVFVVGV